MDISYEHLGGVIYDGIWVGENSKVPNVNGLRKELIDEMKKIKAPVIRYPGGCFADSYDWRDGIGPADKRPRRTNFWAGVETASGPANHKYETNHFGTNEFVRFCKLIGAQPYLAANVRSLTPKDFYSWVEYCNSPSGSTTLADERAAAGIQTRSTCAIGVWEMNRGAAAETLLPRICGRISPIHYVGTGLWRESIVHRIWRE